MPVDVLLGLQWGDEGKGKIVDYLANDYDVVARFQGGPNAGHTLLIGDKTFVLHTVPSGIFHENPVNLIGNGVVIDPVTFQDEVNGLNELGADVESKLKIAKKAHLIMPTHRILDAASEDSMGSSKIGSTLRGITPTYMDKIGRSGLRVGDILRKDFDSYYTQLKERHLERLKLYDFEFDISEIEASWMESLELLRRMDLVDGEYFINDYLTAGKRVLAEGAQGSMLDIDFGTYPYVTSSNTISTGACTGLGIAPSSIDQIFGISKAYCTRVGSGPFPTELEDEVGQRLRDEGHEYGATTGRPRRCGWIDIPALAYSIMINGVTKLFITKIDVLNVFEEIKACTSYKVDDKITSTLPYDLNSTEIDPQYESFSGWQSPLEHVNSFEEIPEACSNFLAFLEKETGVEITLVSTGPGRNQLINKAVAV